VAVGSELSEGEGSTVGGADTTCASAIAGTMAASANPPVAVATRVVARRFIMRNILPVISA
jgi:hypothetical protein